jgi:hypothetical protein
MCTAIALKLCTWLCNYDLQINFKDGCYRPIFRRVLPLEGLYSFLDFFSLWLEIFIWYLVRSFAIPRYRSSLSWVLIHWVFTKLWPLDLKKKISNYQFYASFFSLAHLSWKLKWAFLIAFCPSSFCPSVSPSVRLDIRLSVRLSVNFYIFDFFSRTTGPILSRLDTNDFGAEGILNYSNEGDCSSPRGDNSKRVKIFWNFKNIFFSRTSRPISMKLGINHPWIKGIINC